MNADREGGLSATLWTELSWAVGQFLTTANNLGHSGIFIMSLSGAANVFLTVSYPFLSFPFLSLPFRQGSMAGMVSRLFRPAD